MKITTTRICGGEYNVYINGQFAGTISNGSSEDPREWMAFDKENEWIGTCDTKRQCLSAFKWMSEQNYLPS
tara:strand:+ start:193 stop:405 length:213 start_codon:yes stop_codon:yes gene_type:complete